VVIRVIRVLLFPYLLLFIKVSVVKVSFVITLYKPPTTCCYSVFVITHKEKSCVVVVIRLFPTLLLLLW
jgi:hypothetical protein